MDGKELEGAVLGRTGRELQLRTGDQRIHLLRAVGERYREVTSQTGSQVSGDFQATCANGTTLVGTMVATHSETAIPWAASGMATQGTDSCPFTLTGTGTFQGTSNILVTYAGTVCSTPVSGSETIKRL